MKIKPKHFTALAAVAFTSSLPAQLVYHWTFDADGANSAGGIDMTFNSNAAVSESCSIIGDGAVRLSPVAGNAAIVGGATTESDIDWSTFANGDTRTFAMWVRPETAQEGNSTWLSAGVNATGQRFDVKTNGANFRVEIQGTGQTTGSQINDNSWHHVAVVIPNDGATLSDALFYIDGAVVANNSTNTAVAINTATAILRIGDSSNPGGGRNFRGLVDDVRIYESALTLAEIQTLASAGRTIGCFQTDNDTIIIGDSIDLAWESTAASSLTITNDQDATTIDAFAIGASGIASVSPTTTTTYTITSNDGDSRDFTLNVQLSPDVNTLTSSPALTYGSGDITLDWTTASAGRIEITDDQGSAPIVYTASGDTQAFLDVGSVTIPGVSTTTVFTLTATLAEDGTGTPSSLQTTAIVQAAPDLTLVAAPSIASATSDVTLYFNATVIETDTEIMSGVIEGFGGTGALADDQVQDNDVTDFATILTGGPYIFEVTDGDIAGNQYDITSFSGDTLVTDGTPSVDDFTWQSYRIIEVALSGTDSLSISDGTSTVFSTTDPTVIANGSVVIPNVSADTTFTASATITGFGTATDDATFTVTGDGSSYEEVILSQSPIAYYQFEESLRSTVIYDSSGNEEHSTSINNPEFLTSGAEGIIGNGGLYDEPANTGATVVTPITLDPSATSWSFTALARADDLFDNVANLVSQRDGTGSGRSLLYLLATDATLTTFASGTALPAATSDVNENTPFLEGAVCHVAVTYDLPTTTMSFYLDGKLDGQATVTPNSADGVWVIGAQKLNQAGAFWDGILDEVAIFDAALTAAEVNTQNATFLTNSGAGILAFGRDSEIFLGDSVDLFVKVGAESSSASIDNGVGTVAIGASSAIPVSPTTTTTYTLDVDGEEQTVTITVLPPETVTVTNCGFEANGDFFIDVAEGVTGFKVTTSPDLSTAFADATGVTDDGANRFTIPATSLDGNSDGSDFFRVEAE